jgi:hypothetical protein
MNSLIAHHLLMKAANISMKREEAFSRKEITKKLNEIKYLASQKKVPKISLRKEIVHLENEIEKIFQLEEVLIIREKKESAMVKALKDQMVKLKKQLAMAEDKDLQRKVNKLSYLLGESLAQNDVLKEVNRENLVEPIVEGEDPLAVKIRTLQRRLSIIKQQLAMNERLGKGIPEGGIELVRRKMSYLEQKIELFSQKHSKITRESELMEQAAKHVMLFDGPPKKVVSLPPPPQMS